MFAVAAAAAATKGYHNCGGCKSLMLSGIVFQSDCVKAELATAAPAATEAVVPLQEQLMR